MPERITFKTADNVEIVGDWVTSPTTSGAVVLLHMFPSARHSWAAVQAALARRGLASLAIDLRGHGESTRGPGGAQLDFQKFKEDEHASSIEDVRAAVEWIRGRGIERTRIAIAGASIGANLALEFLASDPQTPAAVLLSPGENYHGVTTLDVAEDVLPHQAVWMAASAGDDDGSARTVDALEQKLAVEQKTIERLRGAGHGNKMFEADTGLMDRMADWLRDRILSVT